MVVDIVHGLIDYILVVKPGSGSGTRNSLKEFYSCNIGNCKGSSSWVRQQSQNTQVSEPQID